MKRFNVFNQQFSVEWLGESAGYIETKVLTSGEWVTIGEASPTIITSGKDKMQCLELLKKALVEIYEKLKELYGNVTGSDTEEPEDVDDFINWILSEKTEYIESGFNVNY